jgi:hypothetical protein
MGFLMNLKRKTQGEAHLRVIFYGGPPFDRIAFDMLKWTLADRGIEITDEIMHMAQSESDKYPGLKVAAFVDGIANQRMNNALRGY